MSSDENNDRPLRNKRGKSRKTSPPPISDDNQVLTRREANKARVVSMQQCAILLGYAANRFPKCRSSAARPDLEDIDDLLALLACGAQALALGLHLSHHFVRRADHCFHLFRVGDGDSERVVVAPSIASFARIGDPIGQSIDEANAAGGQDQHAARVAHCCRMCGFMSPSTKL
ncbi:hypothetical protein FOB41_15105 [Agrobacterium pusense]|uniref:Uncharacterized protein n=1 Tax=Agrobacterium pusense TaxID=648995 RepID=A0A6H0ZNN8_9HYPH|nr:hypothetical protein [Agrobacterium pusense]QIX22378.1 hypothetical protein FOB41_15105 [Agrobacterium pusense]